MSRHGFKVGRCGCYLTYKCVLQVSISPSVTGNVATPAETEIAECRMKAIALVYSPARFVQCTEVVVFLNEEMGWVNWIIRWKLALFRMVGYIQQLFLEPEWALSL